MELSYDQIVALGIAISLIILTAVVSVVIFYNRKEIGPFFKNLKKLKYKEFSAEASDEKSKDNDSEDADLQEESAELPGKEKVEETERKDPETKKEWEFEMFDAILSKEVERAEKARDHLISITENREDKDRYSILFLRWNIRFSKDLSSIVLLEEYTNKDKYSNKTVESAYSSLADIKSFLEDFDSSISYLNDAISMTTERDRICGYKIEISSNLHQDNKKEEAFELLSQILGEFTEKDLQKKIYGEILRLHKEDDNSELSAFAAEKMIECGNEDSETYFSAARAYSEINLDKLALLHYKKAIKLGGAEGGTLNNIGVEYDSLGMPIKSIESYAKSFEKDNTLAAANRAYRLIDSGFINEAKDILNKAKEKEDVHPNVHTALASITKKEEAEEEKEKKVIEDAKQQKDFMRNYASKYFIKTDNLNLQGDYKIYGKYEAKVSINKGKVLITWKKPGFTEGYFYDQKIEGVLHNNASKINFFSGKIGGEFEKDTEGYLYIEDSNKIKIAKQNSYHKQNYEISEMVKI
ncbi:MAG: Flp pilus assembly protein TadD [Flavobacteriaceae bacterium]|jgi:Flp pilus assembly protein TadD